MSRLKVLYVITTLEFAGAQMMLFNLIKNLQPKNIDMAVVSLSDVGPVGEMIQEQLKVPVWALGLSKGKFEIGGIFRLKNIIKQYNPDIIHSHMVHANLLSRVVRLLSFKPPLICTAHNIEEKGSRKHARFREIAYRITDPWCNLTTQVSEAGMDRYIKIGAVPKSKITYMPNGIRLDKFNISEAKASEIREELKLHNSFVFLAVGALTTQKDYPNMLQAFYNVKEEGYNAALLIAGDGELRNKLREFSDELNLKDDVYFLGIRKDIPELMNIADAYVMSSAWEGMPMVLLEAAASGLPIVFTDVGGNKEVVMEEKGGFIVPPKNTESLAKAMINILKLSPEERQKMGQANYNYVKTHFSIDKVASDWAKLYERFINT